jgi:hypothetical protein
VSERKEDMWMFIEKLDINVEKIGDKVFIEIFQIPKRRFEFLYEYFGGSKCITNLGDMRFIQLPEAPDGSRLTLYEEVGEESNE